MQVVMITLGYALVPLTGTPGPANGHENPGPYVIGGPPFIRPKVWITRPPSHLHNLSFGGRITLSKPLCQTL